MLGLADKAVLIHIKHAPHLIVLQVVVGLTLRSTIGLFFQGHSSLDKGFRRATRLELQFNQATLYVTDSFEIAGLRDGALANNEEAWLRL